MTLPTLRILVADDHDLIRQGTCAVIERHPGWEVCGVAANGREAVTKASNLKPDVVVMDMTMPELNGVEAAFQIKREAPDIEIVLLSAHQSEDVIRSAFEAGVKSFIFKTEAHESLVEAIETVARHQPFLTPIVSEVVLSRIGSSAEGDRLTARERETVQLIAEGKSNREVADALGISVRTAENHRAAILRKLNLESLADLVRYAIRNKIIEP